MTRRDDVYWAAALAGTGLGWWVLDQSSPVAGAYFAGLAMAGQAVVYLRSPSGSRWWGHGGDGGHGGNGPGGQPRPPFDPGPVEPNDPTPTEWRRNQVLDDMAGDLTARDLIEQWAAQPAPVDSPQAPQRAAGGQS